MDTSLRLILSFGALLGFISVAAGAFGSHALKQRLDPDMLAVFEVGARYNMYHALAIFAAAWLSTWVGGTLPIVAGWLFISGTLIFSGTLYALAISSIRMLGAITPIGGVLLLAGWLSLFLAIVRK